MSSVRVLEWVRYPLDIWSLPRDLAAELAHAVPGTEVWSPATREEAEALLPEAEVVLGWAVRPHNLTRARKLRWVHSTAASVAHVLFDELVEADVQVTNASGLHADAMAEHTIGVMLAFARNLHRTRDEQLARRWSPEALWRDSPGITSLAGTTLGLIGLGRVGSAIARRARALGVRVIAVRRRPEQDPAPAHEQWPIDRLDDLLETSDWVVIAAPHTRETERLIGARELTRMKRGARLVNLGRGALVDEAALVEALRNGTIAGASLDVFDEEPLPPSHPFWGMPEMILTPHTSGLGPRYWERALEQFTDNLRRYVAGQPLRNLVDKRAGS
jgi:phosphoglycerate dehydrogenase-like enzyme